MLASGVRPGMGILDLIPGERGFHPSPHFS